MIVTITAFIILLGVLILVHEMGHYLAAKKKGVGVKSFSIGFGPKIISWKHGDTEWKISLVPLGGYVRLVGEMGNLEIADEEKAFAFQEKTPKDKIFIAMAGPVGNVLFAWVLLTIILTFGYPRTASEVGSMISDGPAAKAGILAGDRITAVNGSTVVDWQEMTEKVVAAPAGKSLKLTIEREGTAKTVSVIPVSALGMNKYGEMVRVSKIGAAPSGRNILVRKPFYAAPLFAATLSWEVVSTTVVVVAKLIAGSASSEVLGGPIQIARMTGATVQQEGGLLLYLVLMAVLSLNLGVMNLLPIPILDGGHIVFALYEKWAGKPVSKKSFQWATQIGAGLIVAMTVFVFYNDLCRILPADSAKAAKEGKSPTESRGR